MSCFGIQHFVALDELDVAGGHFAFLVHVERELARFVIGGFEFNPLQVEHDVGHVFDHAGQRGEFVLRAVDFDRGDGGAFERGKEHAAERISDRVAVAGLKGFGDKLGVGFSGRRLLFDEGLRHFKTTVTNWHRTVWMKEELRIKKSGCPTTLHPSAFLLLPSKSAGFPLASAVSRPATETQGPTAQRVKNSLRDVE